MKNTNRNFRLLITFLISILLAPQLPAQETGDLQHTRLFGKSLQGNLEGDDPERDVYVYLPPSYKTNEAQRYPVIYFLHGYTATAKAYIEMLQLPGAADRAIGAGANEAIIVLPDAHTLYGGSMYSNSATVGDWETFIAEELVDYIDEQYRTLAQPASRGLGGHSMGGYGTLRIAMKRPGVFSALYVMSPCCLFFEAPGQEAVAEQIERMEKGPLTGPGFLNAMQAQAAAWAPNPQNPPYYFDWPYKDGVAKPVVQAKWRANAPMVFVDQYVPIMKQHEAIMLEVGDQDPVAGTGVVQQFDQSLTRLGIEHGFEVFEGDHGNRTATRFVEKVIPFFSEHLESR